MQRQKNLNMEIKRLQEEKNKEFKEYQKQVQQNQNKIQEQKEKLMHQTQKAEIKIGYSQKQHSAMLVNIKRMNAYIQKLLTNELQGLKVKIKTEVEVHKELKDYLVQKQEDVKKKSEEWNMKFETEKERLDKEIADLTELKETTLGELSVYKQKYEQEEKRKLERQMAERQKSLDKQNEVGKLLYRNIRESSWTML